LVADDSGVHLKIPGDVHADPVPGQLTVTFAKPPQVPFTKLHSTRRRTARGARQSGGVQDLLHPRAVDAMVVDVREH
jgi:hypothetical protein